MDLNGKVIAVTGAFGTLGSAVVGTVLHAGARVAAIDVTPRLKDGAQLEQAGIYGGIDLGDAAAARRVFERIATDYGRLDGLVNIAGAFRWETLADGSLETWDLLYRINVRTAAAASQAALPYLIAASGADGSGVAGGGRIVNVGAAAASKAAAGMGAYAASKAAVAKLTEALAEELKEKGITVNAVLPSIIDTPVNRTDMPGADFAKWVRPAELAGVIVFLLSSAAQAITGALIPVTGRV